MSWAIKLIVLYIIYVHWTGNISGADLYHSQRDIEWKEKTLSEFGYGIDKAAYVRMRVLGNKHYPYYGYNFINKISLENAKAITVPQRRETRQVKTNREGNIKVPESPAEPPDKKKATTTQSSRSFDEEDTKWVFQNPGNDDSSSSNEKIEGQGQSSRTSTGTSAWVFIVIGASVVFLIVAVLGFTLVYRRRQHALQQERLNRKPPNESTSGLIYDTQRSGSTDKGTERSKSTVSTYLSKDSRDATVESHELLPLDRRKQRSSVQDVFEESALFDYHAPRSHADDSWEQPLPLVKVVNTSSVTAQPNPQLLGSCVGCVEREDDWETAVSSSSFFSMPRDDGNKLRGGNGDFHRKYVDVDYVRNETGQQRNRSRKPYGNSPERDRSWRRSVERRSFPSSPDSQPGIYRSHKDRGRNESNASSSTSHHSARSYISIPPTSPSENYIEAGSDDISVRSERSTPPIRMEWLTKSLKVDAKNEYRNYHANSETQTESDIRSPKSKTVFGTDWPFGGTFNNRGGVMQATDSDVSLVVVADAIPKGEYVDIYGAVFTDSTEIRRKFDFPAEESLITPVVEYHAVPGHPFLRHVCIQLPHALPDEFDSKLIRVYTFTVDERGRVSLRCLPMSSRSNNENSPDGVWEKGSDGCSIQISTMHFSGYFCTMCETSSLPSICTMVFGSHVQITQTRREVRVILYIWDRRLTIKDYLERFRKQESDVDRQLLTDMQVPLLDSASSDSRLVMRLEVMGEDDDRQRWKHVHRPDGSRPLFKPLQARKLSEIVHCCRQTDPIRVEWALENAPQQIPSSVFQCCIDLMHVHESTRDYETAMREDNDDLMRTFYVRDLKVLTQSPQEMKPRPEFQRVDVKRTLSEALDTSETERVCQEYGITNKDIGNFRRKYSSGEQFQLGLVEECMRRHGQERFIQLLPAVLEKLSMTRALGVLEDKKVLVKDLTEFKGTQDDGAPSNAVALSETTVPKQPRRSNGDGDNTRRKSPYRERSGSPRHRHRSSSPPAPQRRQSREDPRRSQKPAYHQQMSQKSDDVFVHNQLPPRQLAGEEHPRQSRGRGRDGKDTNRAGRNSQRSPPHDYDHDEENEVSYRDPGCTNSRYTGQEAEERQPLRAQKTSSSGSDSVLRGSSMPSRDNTQAPSGFSSRSTLGYSMVAHADPKDFAEPYPEECLDEYQKQTYKKEIAVQKNLRNPYSHEEYRTEPDGRQSLHLSDSGPRAIPPESRKQSSSSSSGSTHSAVPSQRRSYSNRRHQSSDLDQTSKKEFYGVHTVI